MLLEFRFKNFKSFKDEVVLNLVASNDKSHPENLIDCPDDKDISIVSSAAIYGANASGKSTVFEAFRFARNFVNRSAKNDPDDVIETEPFIFDEKAKTEPSTFEFTFIRKGIRYQYGFSVNRKTIQKEWLISYPKGRSRKLFERQVSKNGSKYSFSSFLKGEKGKLIELTHQSALFLSIGATFNNPQLIEPYRWFVAQTGFISSGDLNQLQVFKNIAKNSSLRTKINALLRYADLGIVDFSLIEEELKAEFPDDPEAPESLKKAIEALRLAVDEITKDNKEEYKKYNLRMTHLVSGGQLSLPWEAESEGTRRLLTMSVPLVNAIESGRIIFVDEIDRSLHPLLVRELIKLYNNREINPKGAQLIFNTHDTSLLGAGILRRDQVWFLEKDQTGASHMYSLLEYSPRKDESLEKGYLQGRYGAVPFLGEYPFGGN